MMEFQTNTAEIKKAIKNIKSVEPATRRAFYSALNRTTQMTRTESSRKIRTEYQVKAKDVNKDVIVRRGSVKNLNAELRWRSGNIPLIRFRSSPSKVPERPPRVLKASVKRTGLKKIPGAFVAKMGSGHVGIFVRVGKTRLPIRELYGPAIPVMLNQPGVVDHLQEFAREKMEQRFDHEVNRQLGKVGEKLT